MNLLIATFGLLLSAMLSIPAAAQAPTPTPDCEAERCSTAVQDAVAACGCDTAATHGQYVSCVARAMNSLAQDGTIDQSCKGKIKRCAARSDCGKPAFETCTKGQTCLNGACVNAPSQTCTMDSDCPAVTKCHVVRIAPVPTPDKCSASGGTAGSGSCCPSCP
jgi:hypothetical protein